MSPQNTSTSSWQGAQSWAGWGYQPRKKGPAGNPNLRVSDAERADVADRLSKHYGDGRLDQAEFNDRMERAMNAKTQGDFAGLFDDLPDVAGQEAPAQPPVSYQHPRRPGLMSRILMLILLVVAAVIVGHVLTHWFFPWLLVGIVAFLLLRHHERRQHGA